MARIRDVSGVRKVRLLDGWGLCATQPSAAESPRHLEAATPRWTKAKVPGTVAQALKDVGAWNLDDPASLHHRDYWYKCTFSSGPVPAGEARTLHFEGLATFAEVWLNGQRILLSDNMFHTHDVEVGKYLQAENELYILFRALNPLLAAKKPKPRWKPRMFETSNLRFFRTTLLGHMPGWCPPVHAIGPWRDIWLEEHLGRMRVLTADVRPMLEKNEGTVRARVKVDNLPRGAIGFLQVGDAKGTLEQVGGGYLEGQVVMGTVKPWWPHTHGDANLYRVEARVADSVVDLGQTGFRTLTLESEGGKNFGLKVNDVPIFARGACWTTPDLVSLGSSRIDHDALLRLAREAGMNMLRVGGTFVYESDAFFDLCDELGLLVWHDFMFANLDYPAADALWLRSVVTEAEQFVDRAQLAPSLAVLCGGSEVEQQAAMMGLSREAWSSPLFREVLPGVAQKIRPDVPYWPNSPSGGTLPFQANRGATHYYGVGAYLRPLDDSRRAEVQFASECLAFANIPEASTLSGMLLKSEMPFHHPRWKERVPRDLGANWDFDDVRDHYLKTLFKVDPSELRYTDMERYLACSRVVTGEVMSHVFSEWRSSATPTNGGLVWFFQDLWPGAGWGVVDALGTPKAAWHYLKRAFAPVTVLLTDEGLNGLRIHVVNERKETLAADVRLVHYRHGETPIHSAKCRLKVPGRGRVELWGAELSEHFYDATYAYRFGPPAHDVTVVSLYNVAGSAPIKLAEAFHFPQGHSLPARGNLGLEARVVSVRGVYQLNLKTKRFAQAVHIDDENFRPADDYFHMAPGASRLIPLTPLKPGVEPDGELHALNLHTPVRFKSTGELSSTELKALNASKTR
jgi:beta-mannosidase